MTLQEILTSLPRDDEGVVRISSSRFEREFASLPRSQQEEMVKLTRRNAKQRFRRLGPDKINPATTALENRGGLNSDRISRKNTNQLVSEFRKNVYFLEAKTSTITGDREYFNNLDRMFADWGDTYSQLNDNDKRALWRDIDALRQNGLYDRFIATLGSEVVIQQIYEMRNAGYEGAQAEAHIMSARHGFYIGDVYADDPQPINQQIRLVNAGFINPFE